MKEVIEGLYEDIVIGNVRLDMQFVNGLFARIKEKASISKNDVNILRDIMRTIESSIVTIDDFFWNIKRAKSKQPIVIPKGLIKKSIVLKDRLLEKQNYVNAMIITWEDYIKNKE